MAYTPGPWHRNIKPARKYCVIFAGRSTHIAAILHDRALSDEEAEANHNLMTAAPDMLAALQMALPALEWCEAQWADSPQHGDGINVLDVVRAAIAKAEGRA